MQHKDARILVIDDEPMMSDSLKQNLVEEGYTVDTAATGAEAIDPFHSFIGSDALRMSLAARIIEAHGGEAGPGTGLLRVRLPIKHSSDE